MATMPMTPAAGMQPADTQQPMDPMAPPAAPEAGGMTICITAMPDGTFTVGPMDGEMQPASDIKGALTIAAQMLRGEDSSPSMLQDQFAAGYSGANGPMGG